MEAVLDVLPLLLVQFQRFTMPSLVPCHLAWGSAQDMPCFGSSLLIFSQHVILCSSFSYCMSIIAIFFNWPVSEALGQIMLLLLQIQMLLGLFPVASQGGPSLGGGWRWAKRRWGTGSEAFTSMQYLLLIPLPSRAFSFPLLYGLSILNKKLTRLRDSRSLLCLHSSRLRGGEAVILLLLQVSVAAFLH